MYIVAADLYFLQFCRKVETLYGKEYCTPNMHLHLHLKESFFNYGPPNAFWCFAFERYNGILGSYHSNKKSIESQFMKKFLTNQAIYGLFISNSHPLGTYFPVKYMEEGSSNTVFPSIIDLCNTPSPSEQ